MTLTMEDITEMDEQDIGLFVREEPERLSEVTEVIDFARALEAYALDELDFREDNPSPEAR